MKNVKEKLECKLLEEKCKLLEEKCKLLEETVQELEDQTVQELEDQVMKRYIVDVERISSSVRTIEVYAESIEDAENKALEDAVNLEFTSDSYEYQVLLCEEYIAEWNQGY